MKNILIICSWLNHKSNVGSFFIEQGEIFSGKYKINFLVFNPKRVSIKNLIRFNSFFKIEKQYTLNGSPVIYCSYPFFKQFGFLIDEYIRKYVVYKLFSSFKKSLIQIDFVHAQSLIDAGVFAFYIYKRYKIPFLLTEHNQLGFLGKNNYNYNLVYSVLESSSFNLVVSRAKIQQFASNSLFNKFEIIGNLVNDAIFNYSKTRDFKRKFRLRLITIGAYSPVKNQETIFEALKLIDNSVNDVEFVWVGFNSWAEGNSGRVHQLVSSYKLKNISISLIPSASRFEVAENLRNSDLFILSSLIEGLPVSVLEALACGIPVFSTFCGGVEEIIDNTNGRLYHIGDSRKLADLLIDFYNYEMCFNKELISENIISIYGRKSFSMRLGAYYRLMTDSQ